MTSSKEHVRGELALLVVCLIWGCNFAVMKFGYSEISPWAFSTIRLTMSAVFLGVVYCVSSAPRSLPQGSWPTVVGLSLLGYFCYQVLFMSGLSRTTTGNAALILAGAPVWTVVVGRLRGDRVSRRAWLGVWIAFSGTTAIALGRDVDIGSKLMLGNLLTLAAACAWGSFTALSRGIATRASAISLSFYSTLIVLPLHWLVAWPHLDPLFEFDIALEVWLAMVYSGVLGTGFALILFNLGLRRVGASLTAGITGAVPIVALIVGVVVLDEKVVALQVFGGALVIYGVWNLRKGQDATDSARTSPADSVANDTPE